MSLASSLRCLPATQARSCVRQLLVVPPPAQLRVWRNLFLQQLRRHKLRLVWQCPSLYQISLSKQSMHHLLRNDLEEQHRIKQVTAGAFSTKNNLPYLFDPETNELLDPPHNIDYFSLFGIDRTFHLDTDRLSQVYKQLQRQLHPDKFSVRSEADRQKSETWSSLVNSGYNNLLKPLPRALYLLELLNCPLEEGEIQVESDFLLEVMELNEEVSEAESVEAVTSLQTRVRSQLDQYILTIEDMFRHGDIQAARREVAYMKYYANIMDKILARNY